MNALASGCTMAPTFQHGAWDTKSAWRISCTHAAMYGKEQQQPSCPAYQLVKPLIHVPQVVCDLWCMGV